MSEKRQAWTVLALNTVAFTICFMCWTTNGVLVTYLVDNGVYRWNPVQMGWLIGIPVLTGSVTRLPIGLLTDKYGGRIVYGLLMFLSAIFMYLLGEVDSYNGFLIASLGFGLTGASFAVGIAYTSVWFPKEQQGTALGIFGAGNAGAAITSLGAPALLNWLTQNGTNVEAWRTLPKLYATALAVMGILFFLFTHTRLAEGAASKTLAQRMAPLKYARVWRFGLYYFLVFGGFVALAQWLIPYYVNAYGMTVLMAGLMASIFTLPSGVIRALGGWLSDRWGGRAVMQWVLGVCVVAFAFLIVPRMDIWSPGSGVLARGAGVVQEIGDDQIVVATSMFGDLTHSFRPSAGETVSEAERVESVLVFPKSSSWQEPVVEVGDTVTKRQLLARGVTHIFFQANVWIFTLLVFIVGIAMGIGKAAVYKLIPDYFPQDVGVVGGMVGVLGGLGGFFGPIIFGYLLRSTGLWITCWMFFLALTVVCLVWLQIVVNRLVRAAAPTTIGQIEHGPLAAIQGGN